MQLHQPVIRYALLLLTAVFFIFLSYTWHEFNYLMNADNAEHVPISYTPWLESMYRNILVNLFLGVILGGITVLIMNCIQYIRRHIKIGLWVFFALVFAVSGIAGTSLGYEVRVNESLIH